MESILFHGTEMWTLTTQLTSRICGANLQRKALNTPWIAHMTSRELCRQPPTCRQRHMTQAHCVLDMLLDALRTDTKPVADLVFGQDLVPMQRG